MTDVPMIFVPAVIKWDDATYEDNRQYRRDLPAGASCWIPGQDEEFAVLDFTCPCGCGACHAVTVKKDIKIAQAWLWNGSVDKPTLSPSILCLSPCRWHGHLVDGIFKSC